LAIFTIPGKARRAVLEFGNFDNPPKGPEGRSNGSPAVTERAQASEGARGCRAIFNHASRRGAGIISAQILRIPLDPRFLQKLLIFFKECLCPMMFLLVNNIKPQSLHICGARGKCSITLPATQRYSNRACCGPTLKRRLLYRKRRRIADASASYRSEYAGDHGERLWPRECKPLGKGNR